MDSSYDVYSLDKHTETNQNQHTHLRFLKVYDDIIICILYRSKKKTF